MPTVDDPTLVFEQERARLIRLAYRMLGSFGEAEDVVQDAWLRWRHVDHAGVASAGAFLSRTVTRLCLDVMKSARVRRETYFGTWLPEPVAMAPDEAPGDDLTLTLMLTLERLSPLERAAFLLHDVFAIPLAEIAATLQREPPAVRQLAARARKHVQSARPRFPVEKEEGARIAKAFFEASATGDITALRSMLADAVVVHSDGGGKVHAFPRPIVGIDKVTRMFEGAARKSWIQRAQKLQDLWIDGLPGYFSLEPGGTLQTVALDIQGGLIVGIYFTRNPDKLERMARLFGGAAGAPMRH
ncbi:RNA polymerase sigma factor [Methylorubrum extorquens]|uniref:RNA polymerase sigma factor n=1 Tax=Methylorubrum extorquens TaxID=408 RepID=A0A2N9AN96_METEX|nr:MULTISPECIES: sigma-70 family RNA polymerase sigma factor [Methylorubrum]ARO57111.1 RNA polymerase sigma factor SigJ [Methylorubrum zatmanii]KQO91621.1 RNA polymerase subunit sigma [Methylobacterium sp. Leaf90]WHQ71992.1 sigma-70 family RNA polymerase sigma factor [Methylorubrum extorquens]SOR28789.1 RNA polymerase sigma factor [Methylorubrum extorquens]